MSKKSNLEGLTAQERKGLPIATGAVDLLSEREKELLAGGGYYFTGRPCSRGHIAIRKKINRACRDCERFIREPKRDKEKNRKRCRESRWRREGLVPTRPRSNVCELCGGPPTARALHLDHDKVTGKFRGWLCHYCNTNLGRFGDNIEGLQRAIDYLEKANASTI